MKASVAQQKRVQFKSQLVEAFRGLGAAGLKNEVPALTVVGLKLQENSEYGKVIWRNLDEFRQDVTNAIEESGVIFDFRLGFMTSESKFKDAVNAHKPAFLVKLENFAWGDIEDEFNKKELVRQTDSLIRDLAKAIGNDNNRVTDTMLLAAIAGKLHVGGDANSNIWKEAAKLYNMGSFVRFFKDLLDHSGRVNNASYTDLPDLIKAFRWELDQHPTLHGDKAKFSTGELTWE